MVERGGGADVERGGFCHRFGGDRGRGGRRRGAGPERIMKIMPVQKQTVLVRGLASSVPLSRPCSAGPQPRLAVPQGLQQDVVDRL